jgi:LmbE family N-acetylglucosaminyl deacetylase
MPQESLRIMAFGAHPPDIIQRAGGTLAKHALRGDVTIAVALTDGARHMNRPLADHPVIGPETLEKVARRKRTEMEEACRALGVRHVLFLGLRDGLLNAGEEPLRAVSDVIREYRPDVILTHHPRESVPLTGHPDHADAGDVMLRAYLIACELGFESRYLPHMANSVYLYALTPTISGGPALAALGMSANPTIYVDISDVIEAKKEALLACGPTMGYTPESVAANMARSRGREQLTGVDYAEGFCALHTPVVDYFERRTKGRWLPPPQPEEWQSLVLWP